MEKYRYYFEPLLSTLAYYLMPTHFHFLVRIKEMCDTSKVTDTSTVMRKNVGLLLSGYCKAINKRYRRHGSLFQAHSKAKEIGDERYLLTLISYIHQNPIRSKLVSTPEECKYSSYQDLIGLRDGSLPDREFVRQYFKTGEAFKKYSEEIISRVREEYWV